jgi:outer membrane lipopolysaccharide assembly protein LptE/RlpB
VRAIRIGSFAALTLLACATLLGGCAFGTRNARLVYPPAETAAATAPESEVGTVSLAVADARTGERMIVGHVRNALSMKTADVVITESPVDWVKRALERELQNAGVRVVTEQEGAARLTPASSGSSATRTSSTAGTSISRPIWRSPGAPSRATCSWERAARA